jgi:hypothetical protein
MIFLNFQEPFFSFGCKFLHWGNNFFWSFFEVSKFPVQWWLIMVSFWTSVVTFLTSQNWKKILNLVPKLKIIQCVSHTLLCLGAGWDTSWCCGTSNAISFSHCALFGGMQPMLFWWEIPNRGPSDTKQFKLFETKGTLQ